jgi:hypothetical protein
LCPSRELLGTRANPSCSLAPLAVLFDYRKCVFSRTRSIELDPITLDFRVLDEKSLDPVHHVFRHVGEPTVSVGLERHAGLILRARNEPIIDDAVLLEENSSEDTHLCEEGTSRYYPMAAGDAGWGANFVDLDEEDRVVMVTSFRPSAALLGAVFAAATLAVPATAQQVTVTVNGQPLYLNPGPIERAGRVFVPLRGIFERLGAGVVYAAGTINATKGSTTVSLHIGSTQATVNGQVQYLDVAPFIVGATTYVPLRFIAQSLGANVGYDASTRVVAINIAQPMPPVAPPRPPRPPAPPPAAVVRLRAQQPAPNTETTDRFTVISAEFSQRVAAGSVRVWLDGANRTLQSGVSPTGFSYKPPAPLDYGSHSVRVAGQARDGATFDRSWSFTVARGAPQPLRLTIYEPVDNAPVGRNFTVAGNTIANARVRVTAGASPSATGEFSGTTTAGPKGNFRIAVRLKTMLGQQTVTVRVVATDPISLRSTETMMRLRLNQ